MFVLTAEVLSRSLDELPPQTQRLLLDVDAMVQAECLRPRIDRKEFRFSRRDVRAHTDWATRSLGCTWGGWRNWSTCWHIVEAAAIASS